MPSSVDSLSLSQLGSVANQRYDGILFQILSLAKQDDKFVDNLLETISTHANTVINPGRKTPSTFGALSRNLQEMIALGIELDKRYAADYEKRSTKIKSWLAQVGKPDVFLDILNNLNGVGELKHIAHEGPQSNYHRSYHPRESAELAALVIKQIQGDQHRCKEEQVFVNVGFKYHDIIQRDVMTPGLNEIESADMLAHDWINALLDLTTMIAADNKINTDLRAMARGVINDYRKIIPYIVWKMIVSATTMLKTVDGQPTIFAVQNFLENQAGSKKIPVTSLDRLAFTLSLVDSNLPALVALLKTHPQMGLHLPQNVLFLLPSGERNYARIILQVSESEEKQGESTINQTGLLLGQNVRMFSELHDAWKGELKQRMFEIDKEEVDGVDLWNLAIEAARLHNDEQLVTLLRAECNGRTVMDIFIDKLDGEITFAKNQAPEYYRILAENIEINATEFNSLAIDDNVWERHVIYLAELKKHYQSITNAPAKIEFAKILFFFAAHQPGLYLDNKELIKRVEDRMSELSSDERESSDGLSPFMGGRRRLSSTELDKKAQTRARAFSCSESSILNHPRDNRSSSVSSVPAPKINASESSAAQNFRRFLKEVACLPRDNPQIEPPDNSDYSASSTGHEFKR